MPARSSKPWPRAIERLRRQFLSWRGRRVRGRRIPEALWTAAVKLAHTHGISMVSRALGVDYYALGKRLERSAKQLRARNEASAAAAAGATGGFVELPMPVVAGASASVVEVEDGCGARLRLEVRGLEVEELSELVGSVWSRR